MAAIGGTHKIVRNGLIFMMDTSNIVHHLDNNGTFSSRVHDLMKQSRNGDLLDGAAGADQQGSTDAVRFDGTNDKISYESDNILSDLGVTSGIDNNVAYSQEAWFQVFSAPSGTGTSGMSIAGHASSGGIGLQIFQNSGVKVNVGFRSNSNDYSTATLELNKWTCVQYSRATDTTVKIYINGELDSTHTGTNLLAIDHTADAFEIGHAETRIGPLAGQIALTSVYNRALTHAEFRQNFRAIRRRFELAESTDNLSWY